MTSKGVKVTSEFKVISAYGIETNQLICCANQLTNIYLRAPLTFNQH